MRWLRFALLSAVLGALLGSSLTGAQTCFGLTPIDGAGGADTACGVKLDCEKPR